MYLLQESFASAYWKVIFWRENRYSLSCFNKHHLSWSSGCVRLQIWNIWRIYYVYLFLSIMAFRRSWACLLSPKENKSTLVRRIAGLNRLGEEARPLSRRTCSSIPGDWQLAMFIDKGHIRYITSGQCGYIYVLLAPAEKKLLGVRGGGAEEQDCSSLINL